jgi:sulfonate transport system permease protein
MAAAGVAVVDLHTKQTASANPSRRRPLAGVQRLTGVIAILVLWQVLSSTGVLSSQTLAGPISIFQAGWALTRSGVLPSAVWVSLQRVAIGLATGTALGGTLAVIAGLSQLGDDVIDVPMQTARFVPIIGLQPLIVLWLGIGNVAKVSLIVLAVIFPIYINTYAAVRDLDPRFLDLARSLRLSRRQIVRRVVLPGALPGFLMGLRLAVAVAWLVLVFAEQINATNGIGFLIVQAQTFFQTKTIVVGLAAYAVLGLLTTVAVRLLERKTLSWLPSRSN